MGKMMTVFVLFLALASVAGAADFADVQVTNGAPAVRVWLQGPAYGHLGWWAWGHVSESWSAGYAGPTLTLDKHLTAGVAIGKEIGAKAGNRYAAHATAKVWRASSFLLLETGVNKGFYKSLTDVRTTRWLTLGWHDQTTVGRGPRIGLHHGKLHVWAACLMADGRRPTYVFNFRATN